MGEYADIKRKKVEQMLRWLDTLSGFSVTHGGRHDIIVKHESWNRPYPVPFKHTIIKKPLLVALVKQILATGVCTKDELDAHLK